MLVVFGSLNLPEGYTQKASIAPSGFSGYCLNRLTRESASFYAGNFVVQDGGPTLQKQSLKNMPRRVVCEANIASLNGQDLKTLSDLAYCLTVLGHPSAKDAIRKLLDSANPASVNLASVAALRRSYAQALCEPLVQTAGQSPDCGRSSGS